MSKFTIFILVLFVTLLFSAPALALDPACDPTDPDYAPFDLASGLPYISPEGEIRACTPLLNTGGAPLALDSMVRCDLDVNGSPYATTLTGTGAVFLFEIAAADVGAAVLTCTANIADSQGVWHQVTSAPVNFVYESIAVPMQPCPLQP